LHLQPAPANAGPAQSPTVASAPSPWIARPRYRRVRGGEARLTVALPVYNSRDIVWLALEGLCRQEDVDFGWELLVAEEDDPPPFGWRNFDEWFERLRAAGCVRLRYVACGRMPLARKWRLLARSALLSSRALLLHGADDYSPPRRLAQTLAAVESGADWVQCKRGRFYNIFRRQLLDYDWDRRATFHPCGVNMAARTELARRLPDTAQWKFCDHWFYSSCRAAKPELEVRWLDGDDWTRGLFTDGLNNISDRDRWFGSDEPAAPFARCALRLDHILPSDVAAKLSALAERVPPRERATLLAFTGRKRS